MGRILIFASWITCSDIWSPHRRGSFPLFFPTDSCQSRLFVCCSHQSPVFLGWARGAGFGAEPSGERALRLPLASPPTLVRAEPLCRWKLTRCSSIDFNDPRRGHWICSGMNNSELCVRLVRLCGARIAAGPEPWAPLLLSLGGIRAPCPWATSVNSVVQDEELCLTPQLQVRLKP